MKRKSIFKVTKDKYFFYAVLLLNILLIWFTRFYPSMDGPAHLYNTNILLEVLKGNNAINEFYTINSLPIPNWTSHFILLLFNSFLPGWLAEKILIVLYVAGMALSFRYLIKIVNHGNTSLSILIFPFIYSFLFHLGFYNFCISFIFFFIVLGFWLQNNSKKKPFYLFTLFLLITITYFTNLLIFGFLGLTIGFFIIFNSIEMYNNGENIKKVVRSGLLNLVKLFLVSLPSLVLLVIFFVNIDFFPSHQEYSAKELLKWINDARPFIVYSYAGEEIFTEQYLHIIIVLLVLNFIYRKLDHQKLNLKSLRSTDVLILPVIISAILLFGTPNGSGAGMMSDRYALLVFIFGITYVVSISFKSNLDLYIIVFTLCIHFALLIKHQITLKELDSRAVLISESSKYIEENSIVLPINLSENWLEPHFSNYLGIDKPMVILENYEASTGWFPLKWNTTEMPKLLLADRDSISGKTWPSNTSSARKKQIDFVFLYGKIDKINDPKWKDLKSVLLFNYKEKYKSPDNYLVLYEKI